ncbi:hypothetical protein [endosymbiont GvMRE of Glomus versiforme]|uniref:hypothetical protein n=1 Tax=endosymbiont GvMRE of Glomus versiforme TaxID=2039283 RepID=UPI0011C39867|nr:hypothetical protein [endosymbiont GvMRE of Glomus versiforme]
MDERVNVKLLDLPAYSAKNLESSQSNNSKKDDSSWQIILPVGFIILGLTAMISLLFMRDKEK